VAAFDRRERRSRLAHTGACGYERFLALSVRFAVTISVLPMTGSGCGFPPVDGLMPRLAPATIFSGCEVDLGRGDVAGVLVAGARSANFRQVIKLN
jgi:hypothetical protein